MAYRWKITKDYLAEGMSPECDDAGTEGPRGLNRDINSNPAVFHMYDDDGQVYYRGMIYGSYTGSEPLDDFGFPSAGCTLIKIKGQWIEANG